MATTLSASTTSVGPGGGPVTYSWSGIPSPSTTDWIGLYKPGTANETNGVTWHYLNSGTQAPGGDIPAPPKIFTVPAGLATGQYELRLFSADSYTLLATSAPVLVGAASVPDAEFSAVVTAATVAFDAGTSVDTGATITGYAWDFGDSSTGTGKTVTHAYAKAGTYIVRLTVTDNAGDSSVRLNRVVAGNPSLAAWRASSLQGTRELWPHEGSTAAQMAVQAQLNTQTQPKSPSSPGFATVLNLDHWSCPVYVVTDPNHPRAAVFLYKDAQPTLPVVWKSGQTFPADVGSSSLWVPLQSLLLDVPVPVGPDGKAFETHYGRPAQDPEADGHLAILDLVRGQYFEFQAFGTLPITYSGWKLPTGYTPPSSDGVFYGCDQAGYIGPKVGLSLVDSDGVFPTLADRTIGGAMASGIAIGATIITHDDIMLGRIEHPLGFNVTAESGHIAPATRDDTDSWLPGTSLLTDITGHASFTYAVPLGARYRVSPNWAVPSAGDQISAHPELAQVGMAGGGSGQTVTEYHRMVWTAMREYGVITVDHGATVSAMIQNRASLDTPYSPYTLTQFNARLAELGLTGSPGGPAGTAPWGLLQQVAA